MALFEDLANLGIARGYQRYVLELEPLLDAMGKRGMPVSAERHAEVSADLTHRLAELEQAMQALIPDEVRTCTPKLGYKKIPKDTTGMVLRDFSFPLPGVTEPMIESRWCRLNAWKPSRDGLIRYMTYRGHPIPQDYKTGRTTTGEAELKRLARKTKDFLYDAVLEYRRVGTVLNNHMANWKPGADERVHPVFYYDTGTGQLASRRPNAQNAPKHGEDTKKELANTFRSMVRAKEGHTLVELDYKSFHAQTLAFEAKDRDYLRLAKLDIHSYLTAHFVREPDRDSLLQLNDEALAYRLKEIKQRHTFVRDYKAKRAVLGYGFGMGYRKLYNMNKESFDSQAEAKRLLDTLNGLFPRACRWRDEVRQQAHEQGYLISRFGCIRWFWEVMKWDGERMVNGGDDSEAAVAFLPANDAFCHIKEAMLRLESVGALERYGLINTIHDALMFECPDDLLADGINVINAEMTRPSEVLVNEICPTGLAVEVGVSLGKSWEAMKEWKASAVPVAAR